MSSDVKLHNSRSAPMIVSQKNKIKVELQKLLLQEQVFDLSALKSMMYFLFDIFSLFLCYKLFPFVKGNYFTLISWQICTGTLAWGMFVTGHDCGHGTFSNSILLNDVIGHICHSFLLLPYYPWQRSHQSHHQFHNHRFKDRSQKWRPYKDYNSFGKAAILLLYGIPLITFTFFYCFLGITEGSHFSPFFSFFNTSKEKLKCVISVSCVFASVYLIWHYLFHANFDLFFSGYIAPIMVFNVWITIITMNGHHSESTHVFGDGQWTHTRGALQTVDFEYGPISDWVSKHVTDCHLIHHFFATQIPHYNLKKATAIMNAFLKERGIYVPSSDVKNKKNPWLTYYNRLWKNSFYIVESDFDNEIFVCKNTCYDPQSTLKSEKVN